MIEKQILSMIDSFDTIIIHHHVNPDPDCIGSQLGLKYILEASYPKKRVLAAGTHLERTRFLGEMDDVHDCDYENALVIIVDVGNKTRVEDNRFLNGAALIKIDHHPHSEVFGEIEWVDTTYAACTEMIIDFYMKNKDCLVMNEKAARVLYAGLLTDTGRFYYNSVTERTLQLGAEVYKYPFNKQTLYADIYHTSIEELKFTGYIMTNFTYTESGLGYIKLNHECLGRFNISPDYASIMVNTLSNIKEVIMWIFFVEYQDKGKIRVEFRSRGPIVNGLAKNYGGGGHNLASGALVENWNIVESIIFDADKVCSEHNKK